MKPQFPTVQEQTDYWNRVERLEHERVMNIRAENPNERTQTGQANPKTPLGEAIRYGAKLKLQRDKLLSASWKIEAHSHYHADSNSYILDPEAMEGLCSAIKSVEGQIRRRSREDLCPVCNAPTGNVATTDGRTRYHYHCWLLTCPAPVPKTHEATTALTLDQTEATTDWFDGLADTPYHLRDEGTVDGEGESYSARNL